MSKLQTISGRDLCKILAAIGFEIDHQTGSHIILRQNKYPYRRLTVPDHKQIAKGTMRNIIRECGLTLDEFNTLLNK